MSLIRGTSEHEWWDISWSTDPDVWEAARADLAAIIEAGHH
jgi:hypothetical protein